MARVLNDAGLVALAVLLYWAVTCALAFAVGQLSVKVPESSGWRLAFWPVTIGLAVFWALVAVAAFTLDFLSESAHGWYRKGFVLSAKKETPA